MYLHETLRYFKTILLVIILIFTWGNMASASPADTIKVNARNGEAGGKSIYELYFSVSQQITPNATVTVKFPEGFDLSDVAIASSTTINGGFQVAVSNLNVSLKRTGLGSIIEPNKKVSIKFANVKNPDSALDNFKVGIEIRNDNEQVVINQEQEIQVKQNISK